MGDPGAAVGVTGAVAAAFGAASPRFLRRVGSRTYAMWCGSAAVIIMFVTGAMWAALPIFGVGAIFLSRAYRSRREQLERASVLIQEHARELSIRRRQLLGRKAYGVVDSKPWQREIDRFIDGVLAPVTGQLGVGAARLALRDQVEHAAAIAAPTTTFDPGMSPTEYELFVAEELRKGGWDARTTRPTGDQGVDVLANKGDLRVVIQCKLYSRPVGNDAVQQAIAGQRFELATHAVVVSNAAFTRSAQDLAGAAGVLLLHHEQLGDLEVRLVDSRLTS